MVSHDVLKDILQNKSPTFIAQKHDVSRQYVYDLKDKLEHLDKPVLIGEDILCFLCVQKSDIFYIYRNKILCHACYDARPKPSEIKGMAYKLLENITRIPTEMLKKFDLSEEELKLLGKMVRYL